MVKTPYAVNLRYPNISVEIHTEHSDFKITNPTGATPKALSDTDFASGIVSFRSTNALEDDSATCSIMLAGSVAWDNVLNENDLIVLRIDPNDQSSMAKPENTTIFSGLISEIRVQSDFNSNSVMYQITAQSLNKIFMSYKVGLISAVQAQLSGMGWLWDTALSYSEAGGSSGSDDSLGTSTTGKDNENKIWNYLKSAGMSDHGAAGVLAQMYNESRFDPAAENQTELAGNGAAYANGAGSAGIGLLQWTGTLHKALVNETDGNWKDLGKQLKVTVEYLKKYGLWSKLNSASTAGQAESDLFYSVMGYGVTQTPSSELMAAHRIADANRFYSEHKGTTSTGSSSDDDSDSSSSSNDVDSIDSSGNMVVDSSSDAINREKSNSIGVAFFGNTVATIETNLINRFKPYIKYWYDNSTKTIWDFIDYSDFQSWKDYEYLYDSTGFSNFKGSLYDLMVSALRQPFNEMFWDFENDGTSKLIVRRTPFNPDDWSGLARDEINSSQLLSQDIGKTDAQQYSVFVDNPASSQLLGVVDGALLGAYPQYHQSLVDKYGYSDLEVSDLYLSGKGSNVKQKGKTKVYSMDNEQGTEYKLNDVLDYLNNITTTTLRQRKAQVAKQLADLANNISGNEASNLVEAYIDNGYTLTQEQMYNVLDYSNGGGRPNTGSHDISYKSVNSLIKRSPDQATFLTGAKSYFSNVSDEFLKDLWAARGSNGSLSKKEYKSIVSKDSRAGSSAAASGVSDLKYFTQTLFNWYADNLNFFSGDIEVTGQPDIRVGDIADVVDQNRLNVYKDPGKRYYVEEVTHEFSFDTGYTTTMGVTRGMEIPTGSNRSDIRFHNYWGQSSDFLGGYMGEASIANLSMTENTSDSSGDSDASGALHGPKGNVIAVNAATYGYGFRKSVYTGKQEVYALGGYGERGGTSPLTNDINNGKLILDCSSFIYWCFYHFGAVIPSVTTGMASDLSQFDKVSIPKNTTSGMKIGDLVFFYNCGHVMFYIGGNVLLGWNGGATNAAYDTTGGCMAVTLTAMGGTHDGYVMRYK